MSPSIPGQFWWHLLGTLALQTTIAFMLGFALQRHARSAMWRRTIWRITLIAVATLVICESAGLGHTFAGWARRQFVSPPESPRAVVAEPPIFLPVLPPIAFAPAREVAVLVVPQVATPPSEDNSTWWPGLLWLCGIAIVLVRVALSHAWLALLWRRDAVRDESLLERVRLLARRIGVYRRIRVVEGPRLSGPMTFGMFRPVIGLPSGFARNFNPAQQEAMLAHELAHVTARDPLWSAFADGVCALLWWQPLAWWARRQFRAASEDAADEASLLLENGPEVLAECLVKLGGRLACRQSLAGLGIEGGEYRSGLGRRVKRLLGLSGRPWHPLRRTYLFAAKALGPIGFVVIALAATAWTYPTSQTVITLRNAFQQSALGLAMAVAMPADRGTNDAATTATTPRDPDRIDWKPWSHAAVDQARAEGKPVLVDFTADWCVTAKVNERTSLEVDPVRAKLRELGVVTLRADYTRADTAIEAELRLFDRAGVPLVLVYPASPDAPPKVLPALLTPQLVLDALDEVTSPVRAKPTPKPEAVEPEDPKNNAPKLILEGKAFMDSGKFAEAEAKLQEALKLDPANNAAKHYLAQLQAQRAVAETLRLHSDSTNPVVPALGELPYLGRLFKSGTTNSGTNVVYADAGRRRLMQKLDTIRLDNVSFDGIPLSQVIESLGRRVKALDPEGRGINFIIGGALKDPDIQSVFASEHDALMSVIIRLHPTLQDVTLRQVLDVIVKCAEQPISYTIESYAIVFSQGPTPQPLYTRWFKIDPRTFLAGIREMLGTNSRATLDTTLQTPPVPVETPPVKRANPLEVLPPHGNEYVGVRFVATPGDAMIADARRLFSSAGVDFAQPGRTLIYNERLGMLMARASLEDLDIIERAIQVLNTPPPQVMIAVKFCEIDEEDRKALGFDWLPSRAVQGRGVSGSEEQRKPDSDWSLEALITGASSGAEAAAHRDAEDFTLTGILTAPQSRVVLRALEQRRGVNVLSAPSVTTLSGRQAQIKSVEVRYIVTGVDTTGPSNKPESETSARTQSPFVAEKFELGPVIDVVPYVQADGVTIALTVIPTIKEFVGYDLDSDKQIRKHYNSGDPKERSAAPAETAIPLPIFRLRQIVTSVIVWDGQTLVLSGGSMTYEQNGKTLPNDTGAQKGAARLFGGQKSVNRKKTLLVFVTPTLIDPAGNRVHSEEKVQFTKDSIPPQKPGVPSK